MTQLKIIVAFIFAEGMCYIIRSTYNVSTKKEEELCTNEGEEPAKTLCRNQMGKYFSHIIHK